jgi:hypothetical protein
MVLAAARPVYMAFMRWGQLSISESEISVFYLKISAKKSLGVRHKSGKPVTVTFGR